MTDERAKLGLTVGDPAGIGPEVVATALRSDAARNIHLSVYGDVSALRGYGEIPAEVELVDTASALVAPGRPDPRAARGIVEAVERAARACLAGELDAMVTAPLSKEVIAQGGFDVPGHTELLEQIAGGPRAVMLLVGAELRVALATIHCPLRQVPERIRAQTLVDILAIVHRDLERRFGISRPRIAVCGLNPHAGEGGRFGDEEKREIAPAIARAIAMGIDARGPLSADSLFHRAVSGEFDAVLAMYHDQGLAPLKLHAFGRAVNVTLGLALIRTSVDHGTAFDIAGRGRADAGSMIEAIRLARVLAVNERHAQRRERA